MLILRCRISYKEESMLIIMALLVIVLVDCALYAIWGFMPSDN